MDAVKFLKEEDRMCDRRFSRLYEPIIELTDREIEKEMKETWHI